MELNSSYAKVYKLLLATPDGQALETEFIRACDSAKITGVTFDLETGEKHPEAVPSFKYKFGSYEGRVRSAADITLRAGHVITNVACDVVISKRFGKNKPGGVSTFNCSPKVIDHGTWKARGGHIDSFYDYVVAKFGALFQDRLTETTNRLKGELILMEQTDEFKAARHEALKNYAIEAIVGVMSNYAWLGKEVLKEALDQFIIHDVIDC